MPAKLLIYTDQDPGAQQEVLFDKPQITIGRKPGNDLQFNRVEVSGKHAVFLLETDRYYVSDVGSTNGTLLNGALLKAGEKYPLNHEDIVTITPYRITFVMEQDPSATLLDTKPDQIQRPLNRTGSGTVFDVPGRISTGTAEHEKQAQSPAGVAVAPAPQQSPVSPDSAPSQAQSAAPPPPAQSAASPPPPQAAADVSPQIPPAPAQFQPPPPQIMATPVAEKKSLEMIWLVLGGLFLLLAIGLIVFLLLKL